MFTQKILQWYDHFGRKDLPWQQNPTPYRVWVSEIMLQQTQVQTVISYFKNFMTLFPTVEALAKAPEDKVLQVWTGLGYYARARNLHKAAKIICKDYQKQFPTTLEQWMALPGIGRSTAGAIMSLALEKREPILDGNVKRVFVRFHAVQKWAGEKETEARLWQWAQDYLPTKNVREYNQALMDLGATVCTRGQPKCDICPLQKSCLAYKHHLQTKIPLTKPRAPIPQRQATFIVLQNAKGAVLLEKRPSPGIWGGLWSFPEWPLSTTARRAWFKEWGISRDDWETLPVIEHTFTHFHYHMTPIWVCPPGKVKWTALISSLTTRTFCWYHPDNTQDIGLPAPIKRLLQHLFAEV